MPGRKNLIIIPSDQMSDNKKERASIKEYFNFNEMFGYFFRKKDPSRKEDFSLRSMHFVNKFSMTIFLLAVIYMVVRNFF